MITTSNIVRERTPVPDSDKDHIDVIHIQEHRNGYECEGNFYHSQDPAIAHASRGGRRFYIDRVKN